MSPVSPTSSPSSNNSRPARPDAYVISRYSSNPLEKGPSPFPLCRRRLFFYSPAHCTQRAIDHIKDGRIASPYTPRTVSTVQDFAALSQIRPSIFIDRLRQPPVSRTAQRNLTRRERHAQKAQPCPSGKASNGAMSDEGCATTSKTALALSRSFFRIGVPLYASIASPPTKNNPTGCRAVFEVVPVTGLEPVRMLLRGILSPLRLPFRHTGNCGYCTIPPPFCQLIILSQPSK